MSQKAVAYALAAHTLTEQLFVRVIDDGPGVFDQVLAIADALACAAAARAPSDGAAAAAVRHHLDEARRFRDNLWTKRDENRTPATSDKAAGNTPVSG